jgi:chemotaxis protein CheD
MNIISIGIGEWAVSSGADDILKTYALGSCVAVLIYDKAIRLAGLIHIALPDSTINPEKALQSPGYFADTGLPLMIEEMKKRGATRPNLRLKLAGGASVMDPSNLFDIGKRNILAAKRIMWKSSLGPIAEDTGGIISRTVSLRIIDGETIISSASKQWAL